MTGYRRLRCPGGTYFFTLKLADRRVAELTARVGALRRAYAATLREHPVRTEAIVILPYHLHAIWTLPPGDCDFSTRWRLIKSRFVRDTGLRGPCTASKQAKGERGVWQRRFWEHLTRNEADMAVHLRYLWLEPVRHGLVTRTSDWPWSSLGRDARHGLVRGDPAGASPVGSFGE